MWKTCNFTLFIYFFDNVIGSNGQLHKHDIFKRGWGTNSCLKGKLSKFRNYY